MGGSQAVQNELRVRPFGLNCERFRIIHTQQTRRPGYTEYKSLNYKYLLTFSNASYFLDRILTFKECLSALLVKIFHCFLSQCATFFAAYGDEQTCMCVHRVEQSRTCVRMQSVGVFGALQDLFAVHSREGICYFFRSCYHRWRQW